VSVLCLASKGVMAFPVRACFGELCEGSRAWRVGASLGGVGPFEKGDFGGCLRMWFTMEGGAPGTPGIHADVGLHNGAAC
jgi:hypothetical protein